MKHLYKTFAFAILTLLIYSCGEEETDISDRFLNDKNTLNIYSYISPQDTVLKVRIATSNNIINNNKDIDERNFVKNATVIIRNANHQKITIPYVDNKLHNYSIPVGDFKIEGGEKYFLDVTIDDKKYTSHCTIPKNKVTIQNDSLVFDTESSFANILLEFKDIENTTNHYVLGAKITTKENEITLVDFEDDRYVNDRIIDGLNIAAVGFFDSSGITNGSVITLQVSNVEKSIHTNFKANYKNYNNGDGPELFTEPSVGVNNITGDNVFGLFAGHQLTEKEIPFNKP